MISGSVNNDWMYDPESFMTHMERGLEDWALEAGIPEPIDMDQLVNEAAVQEAHVELNLAAAEFRKLQESYTADLRYFSKYAVLEGQIKRAAKTLESAIRELKRRL